VVCGIGEEGQKASQFENFLTSILQPLTVQPHLSYCRPPSAVFNLDNLEMRRSSSTVSASGRLCCMLFITTVQALPSLVNPSPTPQHGTRRSIHSTEINSLDDSSQGFAGNTSSLASDPILYHEKAKFLTPPIIITLILFLTFAATIIAVFFYGHELRSFFLQKLKRQKTEAPAVEEPGLGFGFDGMTEAEMEALKWRDEKEADKKPLWHIKLPTRPPTLVLEHSPSPPISLDDAKIQLEHARVDKTPEDEDKCAPVEDHPVVEVGSVERESDHSSKSESAIQVFDRVQ
jgi:hypothetical protein